MDVRSRFVDMRTEHGHPSHGCSPLSLCRNRVRSIIKLKEINGDHPWPITPRGKVIKRRDSKHKERDAKEGNDQSDPCLSFLLFVFCLQIQTAKPESTSRSRINTNILLA